jgi:hypothetical protein
MERRSVLVRMGCVIVGVLCTSAFAFSPVGPPTASLKSEHFSAGFDYSHSEIDFEVDWSSDYGPDFKSDAKDMKSDAYLVRFGYGINDDWEFYGFMGVADLRGKLDDVSFDGGNDFSGGLGTKWTFHKEEKLSWGLVYQMGWGSGDDSYDLDLTAYGYGIQKIDLDLESFDIFLAVGATYEMENWRIYGGPALYYYNADLEVDFMGVTILEGEVDEALFGGYLGTEVDLNEKASLYAEYMLAEDAWALGTGVVWKF